jgi:hypothetical protein
MRSAGKKRGAVAMIARALRSSDDVAADRILRATFWSTLSPERAAHTAQVIQLHAAR